MPNPDICSSIRLFPVGSLTGPASAGYDRRRAQGNVGLMLAEGTVVNRPASCNDGGFPFFHLYRAREGFAAAALTELV
jgi:hypothetical protein